MPASSPWGPETPCGPSGPADGRPLRYRSESSTEESLGLRVQQVREPFEDSGLVGGTLAAPGSSKLIRSHLAICLWRKDVAIEPVGIHVGGEI